MKGISKFKRNIKSNKGITLIALVIIIIALLIYAQVSIITLVRKNTIEKHEENVKKACENEIVDTDENIDELKIASASDITESLYGAKVTGYTLPSGTETSVSWKIFYADSNNIYLIADNYVERENLPESTGGTESHKPNDGSSGYPRAANFSNILGDYAGSSRIAETQKKLNNSYFYKEDGTDNYSSTKDNMKSVAYMMDTEAWNSKFLDTNKAEYVIGGPTVELLFKSYNKKYKEEYVAGATSQTGYSIKKQESHRWSTESMLNSSDSLYVISSYSNAPGYWLASPSADNSNCVMSVNKFGYVFYSFCDYTYNGFRPLVCLKSKVQLEKVSNAEYRII